jgi:hypothetical protein
MLISNSCFYGDKASFHDPRRGLTVLHADWQFVCTMAVRKLGHSEIGTYGIVIVDFIFYSRRPKFLVESRFPLLEPLNPFNCFHLFHYELIMRSL